MEYVFDVRDVTNRCIRWIQDWFEMNGKDCNAYLGISGGVDSTVCAALLSKALGSNRVYGIAMPDANQRTNSAEDICKFFGIHYQYAYIGNICNEFEHMNLSPYAQMNLPPRVRMTMLYALSQSNNGRVVGTTNLIESLTGFFTTYGDNASDIEPMENFTKKEVREIGLYLGIPSEWINRVPDDGLPNSKPDEEKLGFNYDVISDYVRTGECKHDDQVMNFLKKYKDTMFKKNIVSVPSFNPGLPLIHNF